MRTGTKPRDHCNARPDLLAEVLWPPARRSILGLLLADPQKEWHLREMARRTGLSPSAIQREVLSLVRAGIVDRRVESRRAYYRANTSCPIFPELRGIVLKTVGLVDVLRDVMARLRGVELAFVYGSMAGGEATGQSDVDLMILGDITLREVVGHLQAAQETVAREVNPTVYSVAEFRQKVADRHHFLTRVLQGPKLFVMGDSDVLQRLAGTGLGDRTSSDP